MHVYIHTNNATLSMQEQLQKKIQERNVVTLELKNILAFLDYLHFAHYQHPGFLVVTGGMT